MEDVTPPLAQKASHRYVPLPPKPKPKLTNNPGLDLHGNTFWEFRLTKGAGPDGRWRRIVQFPRKTHAGDVAVSPAWHQWLRSTRQSPPSLDEQQADVARQERMKVLAAQADARWAAKPSLLGTDQQQGPSIPALGRVETSAMAERGSEEATGDSAVSREETWRRMQHDAKQNNEKGRDPWTQQPAPARPSEWQPKTWQPPRKP